MVFNFKKLLFNQKEFSDIEFHVDGKIIFAHKAILYSQS